MSFCRHVRRTFMVLHQLELMCDQTGQESLQYLPAKLVLEIVSSGQCRASGMKTSMTVVIVVLGTRLAVFCSCAAPTTPSSSTHSPIESFPIMQLDIAAQPLFISRDPSAHVAVLEPVESTF